MIRLTRVTFWATVVVTVFNALSALGGGVAVLGGWLAMPLSMIEGSVFGSYLIPGLVLLVVVGGTQLLAAALLIARRESALLWTAVAGLGMLIWIFVETGIIRGQSFLQVLYFSTGMAQVVAVLALLGIVRWLPRRRLDALPAGPAE